MGCCGQQTYGAALPALAPGVAATFAIAELDGSATKKVRLLRMAISGTALTAIEIDNLRLTKLSSISTGGVAVIGVATPFDSKFNAPTAVFRGFTTAPTGGGVVVGAIATAKFTTDVITTLMPPPGPGIVWDFGNLPDSSKPTLENAAEALALDFNGATPAHADSLDIYAWWTEQPLNS
jgi:hypothetical protein